MPAVNADLIGCRPIRNAFPTDVSYLRAEEAILRENLGAADVEKGNLDVGSRALQ